MVSQPHRGPSFWIIWLSSRRRVACCSAEECLVDEMITRASGRLPQVSCKGKVLRWGKHDSERVEGLPNTRVQWERAPSTFSHPPSPCIIIIHLRQHNQSTLIMTMLRRFFQRATANFYRPFARRTRAFPPSATTSSTHDDKIAEMHKILTKMQREHHEMYTATQDARRLSKILTSASFDIN